MCLGTDRKKWLAASAIASRYALAAVFLLSAVGKLTSPSKFFAFSSSIHWLGFLSPSLLLYAVIFMEVVIVVLILLPSTVKLGCALSFGTLFIFSAILTYVSHSEAEVPCGCFGEILPDSSTDLSVLRNIFLLLLSAFVILSANPRLQRG